MASWYAGPTLTPEQASSYAYAAGFRGEDLVTMVAIAERESSYVTGAHRSDRARSALSGDRGLWQVNSVWDQELMAAGIIRSKADLFDPATNARASMYIYQKQGWAAWGKGTNWGAWNKLNVEKARGAVNRATQSGQLSSDWSSGGSGSSAASTASGAGKTVLPSDATIVSHQGGLFAVFDIPGNQALYFGISDPSAAAGRSVLNLPTNAEWGARYSGGSVNGGNAEELTNVSTVYGTFGNFWGSIVTQVLGQHNPAVNDPGVLGVLAQFAARPDMSEAELQNKLRGTAYWQARTEGELQWNSLSEAERAKRRQDNASRMAQTWFDLTGEQQPPSYWRIQNYVEQVSSGKMGFSEWTETVAKPRALDYTEGPWSRQVREQQEATRQRPIDIENTVARVRETLNRWGLQWTEPYMHQWAKGIVEKHQSDDDLLEAVKTQAQAMFPTKDRDTETLAWAGPWLQTYNRVMEEESSLFTPEIAKAMTAGQGVWDFEQGLKKSGKWLNTRNAREELFTLAGEVGSRMGYV